MPSILLTLGSVRSIYISNVPSKLIRDLSPPTSDLPPFQN